MPKNGVSNTSCTNVDQSKMLDEGEMKLVAASFMVIAALLFLRRFSQKAVKGDGRRYPPSLSTLPVCGAILRGGMTVLPRHFMVSAEQLGPVFSFTIGKRLVVVLNSYDAIFDAFVRHAEAFADRTTLWTEANLLNPELRGIIHSRYTDAYKKYHKLSLSILKEFGFGVQSVTETRILQEVEPIIEEIRKQNGCPFNTHWPLVFSTSNVMLSILFGKGFLETLPKDHSTIVRNSVDCLSNMDMTVNMVPITRFLPMFGKKIEDLRKAGKNLLRAINVGIEFVKSHNSEPTFVGRFLEIEGTEYDHQDLLYVLRDMVFGSTETVSTTIQWAMVELANHPEVLKRLQGEIDELVPGDRLPSLDDKLRLLYTEAVILEIMRRRTVAPLVPHATFKDTKVLEYDLPKECTVMANYYSVHMDQKFWNDPETFRPERFLDENNKITNSQRIIPFGLGKRSCLGELLARQSVFLFLTSLVQHFDILPPEGQKSINVKEVCAVTSTPSPFEVRLIPREKSTHH